MTDPQTAADAAERVQAFVDARPQDDREGGHIVYTIPDPDRTRGRWLHLTEPDLRALLEDRKRMAAELEQARLDCRRLGDAYASGWHDAIAAVRMPGMHEREEAWATYRVARETADAEKGPESHAEPEGDSR